MRTKLVALLFVGLIGLTATPSANAVFQIRVTEVGGGTLTVVDDDPNDTNPLPGQISVDPLALSAVLSFFNFVELGANSNRTLGTPFSTDSATLSQTGTVFRALLGVQPASATVSVVASDTDFNFPAGNPKQMDSSRSDTFTNTKAVDTRSFQSYFGPGNGQEEMTVPSPLLVVDPPNNAGPNSSGANAAPTFVVDPALPYSLTNETILTLGASGSISALTRDQFTGATLVTAAVPEPATMSLLLLGVPALVGIRRMRKRG